MLGGSSLYGAGMCTPLSLCVHVPVSLSLSPSMRCPGVQAITTLQQDLAGEQSRTVKLRGALNAKNEEIKALNLRVKDLESSEAVRAGGTEVRECRVGGVCVCGEQCCWRSPSPLPPPLPPWGCPGPLRDRGLEFRMPFVFGTHSLSHPPCLHPWPQWLRCLPRRLAKPLSPR